ncbi:MAG: helix-turn-helix transcriptional regulator [Clostridia bacterium]|nr:helix-turn-helix transcriptional regulator [Clostridia bacterium]
MSFGERVKNLREDADLNQTELGKRVSMTQRKISYMECGKCEPSIDDIITLCRYFGVSSDYLLGLSDKQN